MKTIAAATLISCNLLLTADSALAQTWTQTSAPITNWSGIAMSSDGTKLVAVVGGGTGSGAIYTSTNSGATWNSNSAPISDWMAVCSSADGSKLAAVNGGIWTNSGTTWKYAPCPVDNYLPSSIASSTDGNTLLAAGNSPHLSTNSGSTWRTISPPPGGEGCAMSANGTTMLLNGAPYLSTNAGATWFVATNLQTEMRAAAASVAGTKLFAMGDAGVWASTNGGTLWFKETNAPTSSFGSIAASADGTRLILARRFPSGALMVSTDSGLTWTSANVPTNYWCSVASSADGNTLAAAVKGGGIWIGRTTPSPQLNVSSAGSNFILSWTVPSTNFVLQQGMDLTSKDWVTLTDSPSLNLTNLQEQLTLAPTNTSGFFRLISQ